jgi:hypothetical protein
MRHALGSPVPSKGERLYRLLLFVYPPGYRREYGPLMVQAYRDLCRDSYRRRGVVGLVPLWVRLFADLATSAVTQHLDASREGDRIMTKTEHARAIVAAALPLALWLVLGAVNPRFASRMFADSPAQPLGWIMAAGVIILVTLAYFAQRKALQLTESPSPSGRAAGRPATRGILRAGSIALFVLPAILLVVLGPAIMTLLDAGL